MIVNKIVRVRIAPSPTGDAHVGHARTALYDYLFAKQRGGTFVLRIDDTDTARNTATSEEGVYRGLRWLGLEWDEGPDKGGAYGPYRQSERLDIYGHYVNELLASGKAYECYCTAAELEAERQAQIEAKDHPRYSGKCCNLTAEDKGHLQAEGRVPTVRLKVISGIVGFTDLVRGWIEADTSLMGDFIILKSSGIPVYNFATVIDDHLMEMTHVTRGAEHIANTFNQLLTYKALGWTAPHFAHFSIMLNEDRSKMSKRKGATFLGQYAEMGYLPEAMLNFLAFLGWSPGGTEEEIYTLEQLQKLFSLERCTVSNAVFDIKKLDWINAKWIRILSPEDLASRLVPFLRKADLLGEDVDMEFLTQVTRLIQERLPRLDEAATACTTFLREPAVPVDELRQLLGDNDAQVCISAVIDSLESVDWDEAEIEQAIRRIQEQLGWSTKVYYMFLRLAVMGSKVSPPLFSSMAVLGKEKVLSRMQRTAASLY
ncbi:MAG: nondiscriminating glutamyl-tRNA synthetase [Bacillota bacterium]|nr:MAG: nondiscriminating glutamyl-tRNA synthetase [Bacillota bacterium]MBS3950501.1 glutamate--tRNA ligase [Peptococcaceae bacterium]